MAKSTLELSREEWKKYTPSLGSQRIRKSADADVESRRREAWRLAKQAADVLKKDFGAQKVFVFGSLVRDIGYNRWSDIDLAVEGVRPELFYSAVGVITGLSSNIRIDLVDYADCSSGLKNAIRQNGREI